MQTVTEDFKENQKYLKQQLPISDFQKLIEFEERLRNDPNLNYTAVTNHD